MIVAIPLGVTLRIGGWQRGFALLFAAKKLAVAAAQNLLIVADRAGIDEVAIGREAALAFEKGFGVDDDLTLAAEVGGQGGVHHAFQSTAFRRAGRWPPQNDAGAAHLLRGGAAIVADDELHHHVPARCKAEAGEIEAGGETAIAGCASAADGNFSFGKGHIFAFANGKRNAQAGGRRDSIIIGRGKGRGPNALARFYEGQRRAERFHLRRVVG